MPESFTETFAAALASYGERPCIEFEGRWYSGDDITAYADAIATLIDARAERSHMAAAAREASVAYTWDAASSAVETAYVQTLSSNARQAAGQAR